MESVDSAERAKKRTRLLAILANTQSMGTEAAAVATEESKIARVSSNAMSRGAKSGKETAGVLLKSGYKLPRATDVARHSATNGAVAVDGRGGRDTGVAITALGRSAPGRNGAHAPNGKAPFRPQSLNDFINSSASRR